MPQSLVSPWQPAGWHASLLGSRPHSLAASKLTCLSPWSVPGSQQAGMHHSLSARKLAGLTDMPPSLAASGLTCLSPWQQDWHASLLGSDQAGMPQSLAAIKPTCLSPWQPAGLTSQSLTASRLTCFSPWQHQADVRGMTACWLPRGEACQPAGCHGLRHVSPLAAKDGGMSVRPASFLADKE